MPNQFPKEVEKYLKKFGCNKWALEKSNDQKFKMAVVVPAISEYENLKILLKSLIENDPKYFSDTIVIIVINNVIGADEKIIEDNQRALKLLRSILNKSSADETIANEVIAAGLNIGLVDISTGEKAMPVKDGGVGFARKTGMDLALSVFDYNSSGKNILLCTDADSEVSENYFTEVIETFNKEKLKAGYVRFSHPVEDKSESTRAIVCYEIFLRYYVLGLKYTNSPFAIHTIGSTMACDFESYIKIQGMNKRKAAEDFYFMEKLAKNSDIKYIKSATVYPSGRGSWRVPFGTGQRVNRYLAKTQNEFLLYSPECFTVLKKWLNVFNSNEKNNAKEYLIKAEKINQKLMVFLEQQNFVRDWEKIEMNAKTDEQLRKQKLFWFDGFRTLKLIHFLRDESFPMVNMFDALDSLIAEFGKPVPHRKKIIPSLQTQIEYLELLREIA